MSVIRLHIINVYIAPEFWIPVQQADMLFNWLLRKDVSILHASNYKGF